MRTFFEGTGRDRKSCLCFRAVGKVSAAITTLLLLERFGVTHIVFTGVAGAIDPGLRIGDVVVAERLVQHDMDASPLPAFSDLRSPCLGKIFFETGLCDEAFDAAIRYTQGDFLQRCGGGEAGRVWDGSTTGLPGSRGQRGPVSH